jgi:hypothetical protein
MDIGYRIRPFRTREYGTAGGHQEWRAHSLAGKQAVADVIPKE